MKIPRPMHPKMVQRAQMVKAAHTHLSATMPAYASASPQRRMALTQQHVTMRLKRMGSK